MQFYLFALGFPLKPLGFCLSKLLNNLMLVARPGQKLINREINWVKLDFKRMIISYKQYPNVAGRVFCR
jgi:hypothetical protein